MKHKLGLKAADLYGRLLNFVPEYVRDNFVNGFEKFLDAYDADIKAEKINVDKTQTVENFQREVASEEMIQLIKDAIEHANFNGDVEKFAKANELKFDEQRDIPKVGEIYRDSHDNRFKIYEVTGKIVAIEILPVDGKELFPLRFLPIEFFMDSLFTKEDKSWHA